MNFANKKNIVCFAFLFIFFFLPIVNAQEKIFFVSFKIFKNDTVIFEELSLKEGIASHFPSTDTGYYVEILSEKNETLFKANLGISFIVTIFTTEIPSKTIEIEENLVEVSLPYFENARSIVFYHESKKILEIDLRDEICNENSLCEREKGETPQLCPIDCHCGNGICEKSFEEDYKNCPKDCISKPFDFSFIIYFLVICIIFILVFLFVRKIKMVRE